MFNKLFCFAFLAILGCGLGNSLISRRSYPMVGTNHCTWGPSYWCGHISKAKECGTMKHCASVWGQQPLDNPTEVCETCEYFVTGAKKLYAQKITQKNIALYMDTLCYHLPGKESKKKCLLDIGNYLTEVLQLLDLGLTPRSVCYAINLCPQKKAQPKHDVAKTMVVNATTTTTTATTTASNKICHDCKVFFDDVRKRLRSNQTVKNVENLFDSTICVSLGPFRDMCRQLIDAFVPVYLEDVSEFVDPGFLCSIMDFCPASQKTHLFEALTQNTQKSSSIMVGDAKECGNCKVFIKNIKKEIDSDTTVDKVKQVLKKDVCSHLGKYQPVCTMAVDTYAQEILEEILSNVDSTMICQKLGLCDGYVIMKSLVLHLKAVKFSKSNPFQESTECELCKVLMSELHSLVKDKKVQDAVKDFINNEVCVRLGDMKQACLTLVKEYEPFIMEAIQSLLEPNSSCVMLGMCSNSSAAKTTDKTSIVNSVPMSLLSPAAAFVPYQRVGLVLPPKTKLKKVGQSEQCKLCMMVMGELEKILKQNAVQKDIEEALDQVCSLLPSSLSQRCEDFVNEYTPGIIELILSQIQPKMVCSALGLCSSLSSPDSIGCSYCSEILGIASGHLSSNPNMSQREFEGMLLKLCTKYGEQYKDMCQPGVQQFGNTVFKALKSDMAPREVCGMIGFCASTTIKPETKHYLDVMCELLRSAGVATECKQFNEISKDINNHFLTVLHKKSVPKEKNALKLKGECSICVSIVDFLKSFAISDMSEEKVKHLLHEVCQYLESKSFIKKCDYLVNKYEKQLIDLLMKEIPAKEVCEALSLCKTSNTLYFKPVHHHNPCDLGVHYWCSSYTTAVKCKAIDLCSSKVWKKNIL